jgi:hypothetical protein
VRRLVLTVRTVVVGTAVLALLLVNLADVRTP